MAGNIFSRIKHAWNIFSNKDPTEPRDYGRVYSFKPDRVRISAGNKRTIVNSIITRIAIDSAAVDIFHVKTNDDGNYTEKIKSGLNYCLTESANLDQTGRVFRQDMFSSILDEGVIAVVPVETNDNPERTDGTGGYDILSLRIGRIIAWYPQKIRVRLYNEWTGDFQEVVVSKKNAAIIENPLYSIMNEPNSTLKRLVRKIAILDYIDEQTGSGKMNLIIQLPYQTNSDLRKDKAEARRATFEDQILNSKYGIAYADGTEKIIQLNRPLENGLLEQIQFLTNQLMGETGITQGILDGTADEQTKLNYHNSTIEPLVSNAVDEFRRKFLTKTARTQHHDIMFFRDPFKLIPVSQIAEISDKLTRNEVMSSNEVRQKIGLKPSNDPRADELRNKNINQSDEEIANKYGKGLNSEEVDVNVSPTSVKGLLNIPLKDLIQKE